MTAPKTLSPEECEAIQARVDAATPGPWTGKIEPQRYPECDDADLPGIVRAASNIEIAAVDERYGNGQNYEADTVFISASRTDVPNLLRTVAELRKEVAREWQPIETAPRNGDEIDLWFPTRGRETRYWRDHGWCKEVGHPVVYNYATEQPTHWMPAPEAPTKEDTNG